MSCVVLLCCIGVSRYWVLVVLVFFFRLIILKIILKIVLLSDCSFFFSFSLSSVLGRGFFVI